MPAVTDYYAVLGVASDASQKEIKTAYRAKARELHPDTNSAPGAEDQFKAVQQAYDAVGDAKKRTAYDRARQNPMGGGSPFGGFDSAPGASGGGRFYRAPDGTYVRVDATGAGPASGAGPAPEGDFRFGGDGLGDLFERYFGGAAGMPGGAGGGGTGAPRGGRDVEATLRLSFEEALAGGPRELTVPTTGETVSLKVPTGVRNGLKIKLGGRGEAGPSGARGDLFLTFQVTPDARFRRDGDDLVATETVTAVQAMLGTTLSVPTAYGQTVRVTVKPGTAPGTKLRVRGQGVRTDKGAGDLTVELAVAVPELSDDARDGLRAWAAAHGLA